ncbi:hypothetical protein cypCar_00045676, partial [Cyprinus carpio]
LKELNLSERKLGDTILNQITALLQDKHCKLNTLTLRKCGLTEESCSALATVLRSNSSLKELDMSNNNLQDSGVKKLQSGLEDTNCTLKKLRFLGPAADEAYQYATEVQGENPLLLRELNLSLHELGDTRVNQIAALLQDKHCKLNALT